MGLKRKKPRDPNLIPSNIRKGVTIEGVVGSIEEFLVQAGTAQTIAQINNLVDCYSTTAFKVYEVRMNVGGTIRTSFRFGPSGTYVTVYARLYVNGQAVGALRSHDNPNAHSTFVEDITIKAGDLVQIYGWTTHTSYPCRLSFLQVTTNTASLATVTQTA